MANVINLNQDAPVDEWLSISNGTTSMIIELIGLSGSIMAQSDAEKSMIVWLLEKDQNVVGLGTVGFCVVDMPWTAGDFEDQWLFMLKVLEGVRNQLGWNRLSYSPNIEFVAFCITRLEAMFRKITIDMIDEENTKEWRTTAEPNDPINNGYPKCREHGMLLTLWGCFSCGPGACCIKQTNGQETEELDIDDGK